MPYRLATPQYNVNGMHYTTVYSKKQAILMLFTKIEEVLVRQKVTNGREVFSKNRARDLFFKWSGGIIETLTLGYKVPRGENNGKRIQKRE